MLLCYIILLLIGNYCVKCSDLHVFNAKSEALSDLKLPMCKVYVKQLHDLLKNHKLCLHILFLSSSSFTNEKLLYYSPRKSDIFFERFWELHKERCISFPSTIQASFYPYIFNGILVPIDILFVCMPKKISVGGNLQSLTNYMLFDYITRLETSVRPFEDSTDVRYCFDGNGDFRVLPPVSRTCILAIYNSFIVVGQPIFDSFVGALRETNFSDIANTFLPIQASYQGCAPHWSQNTDFNGFVPDGHCTGAMGKTKFDLLCCCYETREECSFSTPRNAEFDEDVVYVTCAVGKFNETTDFVRRTGPVETFLLKREHSCTIMVELKLRPDYVTYDVTYHMSGGPQYCHNPETPVLSDGDELKSEYYLRDSIFYNICCNYDMCNNLAFNNTFENFKIPSTYTPQIGREINFYCGYPPIDILRYLKGETALTCSYTIDVGKTAFIVPLPTGHREAPIEPKLYSFGNCSYFRVDLHAFYFECTFNQSVSLPYTRSETWLDFNYNYILRLMRQIKHNHESFTECRATNSALVPLIDFVRGNFTQPKDFMNLCYVYMIFDDFGGSLVKAGSCNDDERCCKEDKTESVVKPCENGFCARANYNATCLTYSKELPDITAFVDEVKFADSTTVIVVSPHSDIEKQKKKIHVPYYCMFGVLELCNEIEPEDVGDARTCLTVPIESYDMQNKNGIRKVSISRFTPNTIGERDGRTKNYFLNCALEVAHGPGNQFEHD